MFKRSERKTKYAGKIFTSFFAILILLQFFLYTANNLFLWVAWSLVFSSVAIFSLVTIVPRKRVLKHIEQFVLLAIYSLILLFIFLQTISFDFFPNFIVERFSFANNSFLEHRGIERNFISLNPALTYGSLIKWLSFFCIYITAFFIGTNYKSGFFFFRIFLLLSSLVQFVFVIDFFIDPMSVFGFKTFQVVNRLIGFTTSPNIFATISEITFLACCSYVVVGYKNFFSSPDHNATVNSKNSFIIIGSMVISAIALMMTASKFAIIFALSVFLFQMIFFIKGDRKVNIAKIISVILFAIFIAININESIIFQRLNQFSDSSNNRLSVFSFYLKFIELNFFGYGLGSFFDINRILLNEFNYIELYKLGALHNVTLQALMEGGLIFLTLVSLLISATFIPLRRKNYSVRDSRRFFSRILKNLFIVSSVYLLLHSQLDIALNTFGVCIIYVSIIGLFHGNIYFYTKE